MDMSNQVKFYQDKRGEWRWRVQSPNGKLVANSGEGYQNKGDAEKIVKELFGDLSPI